MKYRCLNQFRHLGAIERRTRLLRVAGGKPDLVVDHHMYGAAGSIGRRLGEIQGLCDHALAYKGRITMHDHGQNQVACVLRVAVLSSPAASLHDGCDDLQMRRIEGQGKVHRTAWGLDIGVEALMVLDVAGASTRVRVAFTFELGE